MISINTSSYFNDGLVLDSVFSTSSTFVVEANADQGDFQVNVSGLPPPIYIPELGHSKTDATNPSPVICFSDYAGGQVPQGSNILRNLRSADPMLVEDYMKISPSLGNNTALPPPDCNDQFTTDSSFIIFQGIPGFDFLDLNIDYYSLEGSSDVQNLGVITTARDVALSVFDVKATFSFVVDQYDPQAGSIESCFTQSWTRCDFSVASDSTTVRTRSTLREFFLLWRTKILQASELESLSESRLYVATPFEGKSTSRFQPVSSGWPNVWPPLV